MQIKTRLFFIISLLILILLIGAAGYSIIEKWSALDSVYMSVITLSSVGFGEVKTLSANGKIFTIVLIILGIGAVIYGITTITAAVVEGRLKELFRRRKMEHRISNLKGHIIVCGVEETVRPIVEELKMTHSPFVIITNRPDLLLELKGYKDILYVEGNASEENVLEKAGVKKAKALICAFDNDTQNIFIVLTARGMNPNLRIVARIDEEKSESKFRRAGADAVVCPNRIGGLRMASEIIRPAVVSFLDVMMRGRDIALRIEEVPVGRGSSFINQTLVQTGIGKKTGVMIIAIKEHITGRYRYNPTAETKINEGDTLIILGNVEQIESLRKIL